MGRLGGTTGTLRDWLAAPLRPARLGIRPVDVLFAALVIAAVQLNNATATGPDQQPLDALAYFFGAVVGLPVLLRHRWPRGVLVACSVLLLLFYSLHQRDISPAPLLCLPLYDAAAAGFLALTIIIPAVYMAIGLFVVGSSSHQGILALTSEFLPSVVVLLLAILLGDAVRSRRAVAAQTAERLRLADEEREREGARRVAEERLRIARELHDTVAHSMATITVQAASALHVLGGAARGASAPGGTDAEAPGGTDAEAPGGTDASAPGGTDASASNGTGAEASNGTGAEAAGGTGAAGAGIREALTAIRDTSKGALADMRVTLGGLRSAEGERDVEPADTRTAGLARLPALSEAVRAAGAPVTVTSEGEPRPLPPAVDHAAYRILQESLTNVLRHAGGEASATIRLCYTPDALTIRVTDDGTGQSGGVAGADGAARASKVARADGVARADRESGADDVTGTDDVTGADEIAAGGWRGGHGLTGMAERAAALGGSLSAGPAAGGGFEVVARLPLPPAPASPADIHDHGRFSGIITERCP